MARYLILFASFLLLLILPAAAEKRVALVIGNSEYQNVTPLPNPQRDAKAMTGMLEKLGFTVVSGTDLDRQGMADKLREFASKAENADTVLYFYAGHGIQLDGQNYLIPVDADLNNEMDVKLSTLDIDLMLQQTPLTARVKLVLLDACRNNPFNEQIARSLGKTRSAAVGNGLAEMKPTFGTMIAYATGPGEVALDGETLNSPFTKALLKFLPEQGLEIGQAMTRVRAAVYEDTGNRQLPWENKNLTSDYYLVPAVGDKASAEVPVAAVEATAMPDAMKDLTEQNGEIGLWQAVKGSTDPVEIQAYVDRYGDAGIFTTTARKRIEMLKASAGVVAKANAGNTDVVVAALEPNFTPDPAIATAGASFATETALSLRKTDKKILMIKLSSLGFGSRSLSSEFDVGTRMALAKWQEARGYPVTGFLNKYQYAALLYDDKEVLAPSVVAPDEPKLAAPPPVIVVKPKKIVALPPAEEVKKPAYVAKPKVIKATPKKVTIVKPVKKAKPVVVAKPYVAPPPAKKVVVVTGKPKPRRPIVVPKIGLNIGSGGGLGLSLGF